LYVFLKDGVLKYSCSSFQPPGTAAYPICSFVYSFFLLLYLPFLFFLIFLYSPTAPSYPLFYSQSPISLKQMEQRPFCIGGDSANETHVNRLKQPCTCPDRIFVATCLRFLPFDFFLSKCHLDHLLRGS
jgi:hypothetical protein